MLAPVSVRNHGSSPPPAGAASHSPSCWRDRRALRSGRSADQYAKVARQRAGPAKGRLPLRCPKGSIPAETKKGPLRFLVALPPYDAPHPTLELPFWVQKWSKLPAYLARCFGPRQHTLRQIAGRSKMLPRRFPASRGQRRRKQPSARQPNPRQRR
jgi:hypothetical protein